MLSFFQRCGNSSIDRDLSSGTRDSILGRPRDIPELDFTLL